jgi:RND family efflux transporter MFP subunit
VNVRVARAKRRALRTVIELPATLAAAWRRVVTARSSGVVAQLAVEDGTPVRRGQVLLVVERGGQRREAVLAPVDGVVAKIEIPVGAPVTADQTPLLTLVDPSTLVARAEIDEAHMSLVRPGLTIELRTPTYPDRVFVGVIQRVDVAMTDHHTLAFEAPLSNPDRSLRPGAQGTIRFTASQHDGIVVPQEAVLTQGPGSWVYVNADGRARTRQVRVGEVGMEGSEIVAGLKEGEEVLSPAIGLADGRAVTVVP